MLLRRLTSDQRGAGAAEFALVLPLLLILLFGIIDGARYIWEYNRLQKATQVGSRVAVVTDPVAGGLTATSYVGNGGLTQGDRIPADRLGEISCTTTACTCTVAPCPPVGTHSTTSFSLIANRMRNMKPDIADANIRVEYRGSGLGFAGDPNGMEIAPLVTVRVTGMQFTPITTLLFTTFTMPDRFSTLTAEDSAGSQSN